MLQSLPLYQFPAGLLPPLQCSHCRSAYRDTHAHVVKVSCPPTPTFPCLHLLSPKSSCMQLVLEQSSWVVGGCQKEIESLPKFCFLQELFMASWRRLPDWPWSAIHNRLLGQKSFLWKAHFITYLLIACLLALLEMSANIRWHRWHCIFCDSRSKVFIRHQNHFRACRPGITGTLFGLSTSSLALGAFISTPDSPFPTLNSLHWVTKWWKEEEKFRVCGQIKIQHDGYRT